VVPEVCMPIRIETEHPDVDLLPVTPTDMYVSVQPPPVWYQFSEGPLHIQFTDTRDLPIEHKWVAARLYIVYEDCGTLVPSTPSSTERRAVRVLKRSLDASGHRLDFRVKIEEITKNHQSRTFCLYLVIGNTYFSTRGFRVKTKRTKSKATCTTTPTIETDFRRRAKEVLTMLEWHTSGFERSIDTSVDYSRPVYTCPLCRARREHGHVDTCGIYELMNQ
jgi:hypothetical protein